MKHALALLLLLVLPLMACAQTDPAPPSPPAAPSDTADAADAADADRTDTERQVAAMIAGEGTYVVHFWAPWCHNSRHELRSGFWPTLVEERDDVTFIFVTVYNDGEIDDAMLDRFHIPGRVARLAQPDRGPSDDRANRRRTFLGLPLTWTPTTWVFHRNGTLAFAVNHGEVDLDMMRGFLDGIAKEW